MKKVLLISTVICFTLMVQAQENIITLSGGYTFISGEEVNADLSGWRINATYEFNPLSGPITHGIAFGYAFNSGPSTLVSEAGVTVEVGTIPIYYQPKYLFGTDQIKGFVKGALGWQFADITRTGSVFEQNVTDSGFLGGGGAGVIFNINSNFFIQAEYELTWLSNYYLYDGWLNSAMGGIGYRF